MLSSGTKSKKKMPSGSAGGTIREWKYDRVMSFLLPYMQPRNSRHTLHSEEQPLDMSAETCDVDAEVAELCRPYSPLTVTQGLLHPPKQFIDLLPPHNRLTPPHHLLHQDLTPLPPPYIPECNN